MPLCKNHPESTSCPNAIAAQAAELIASAKTDHEAASIATEAMNQITKAAGIPRIKGKLDKAC